MKQLAILISASILLMLGCAPKNSLTETETELLNSLKFNIEIINKVKEKTRNPIEQLPGISEETGEILSEPNVFEGIFSTTSEEESISFVRRSKSSFRKAGYLLFQFEGRNNENSIAVIKGIDEIDILKYRRTDGINHGLESNDIIAKLKDWQSEYGIKIIGCSRDWVHVEFDKLPSDLEAFAEEVYKFCPDSVDQGVGSIEELKKFIFQMNGVWLWWD